MASRLARNVKMVLSAGKSAPAPEAPPRRKRWKGPWAVENPDAGALPDFVIIGAQKCGTTFLYELLRRHDLILPAKRKEVHFFDVHFGKGVDWYRSHFLHPKRRNDRMTITGEASPYYLYHPLAAGRAAEVLPEARLLVLLRNPVDRAYSDYHDKVRAGRETLSFEEALEAEEGRIRGEREKIISEGDYHSRSLRRFSYLSRGLYVDQLIEWEKFFGRDQILVLRSEDLFKDTAGFLGRVFDYLDLPDQELEAPQKRRNVGDYKEPMNPATRERLEEYFEPHNRRLYEHLGVDFGW